MFILIENEKEKCRFCLKYGYVYQLGKDFKCLNFQHKQNACFLRKDCSSVSQTQIINLLLNLRRSSMIRNIIWKYFNHLAFSQCMLNAIYSKETTIRSRLVSMSHQNLCSTTVHVSQLSGLHRPFGRPWRQTVYDDATRRK